MIEKKQIQKMITAILRRQNGLPDHEIMHPFREWTISLSVTILLLGLMVVSCVRLYQHYNDFSPDFIHDETAQTNTIIYRSEEVTAGIQTFEAKKTRYSETLTSLEKHTMVTNPTPEITTVIDENTLASTTSPVITTSDEIPLLDSIPTATTSVVSTPPATEAI